MATYTKYETFVENLANKLIDAFGATDTWKAVIHTDAPVVATDNSLSDLTQIGGSNGYTTGGSDSTTGRYVSIYDDTSAADNLLCSYDYGATFTVATGETFTLDFGASLFTLA
jgi:hypothetical protein